jgi:hypothetical protein
MPEKLYEYRKCNILIIQVKLDRWSEEWREK